MGEVVTAQLRLRRAFRYGYFAFVAIVVTLLALFASWLVSADMTAAFARSLSDSTILLIVAAVLGLSVPLFFAAWLLVGSVLLGDRVKTRPLMDGIRD